MAFGALISALTLPTTRAIRAQEGGPSWMYTGSLNTARPGHTATLLPNGKVLVVGGYSAGLLESAELYDPSTGTWSFTGSLNVLRAGYTATLLGNGKVLVAGGNAISGSQQSDLTKTAELYDPATGEWSFTGSLNVHREGHTATLLSNGKVLFAGGVVFSATNPAELYDPATGKWTLTTNLGEHHFGHAAMLLQDGKVLVAGGCTDPDCTFLILGSAEVYDPNTARWTVTGSLAVPRDSLNLTTLPSGRAKKMYLSSDFRPRSGRARVGSAFQLCIAKNPSKKPGNGLPPAAPTAGISIIRSSAKPLPSASEAPG